MMLERPDAVVAHHADHAEAVTRHRVELHAGEAEGAVAEQQADLPVGVGELGADRLAGPGAEAAERPRVHPAARLVGVDEAAGVGDEVAAVADHDRVAVEHLAQLLVDADRVQRRARVVQLLLLGGALLVLDLAQLLEPGVGARRARRRPPRGSPPGSPRRRRPGRPRARGWRSARSARRRAGSSSSPRRSCRRSRAGSRSARRPRAPRRRPCRPAPRARLKASSWSAGRQPRPSPLRKTGMPSASASARSSLLAVAPVEAACRP